MLPPRQPRMFELNPDAEKLVVEIRRVMLRRNYTIKRMAEEIGIAPTTLCERMNNGNLRLTDTIKICNVLGIDLMWRETRI